MHFVPGGARGVAQTFELGQSELHHDCVVEDSIGMPKAEIHTNLFVLCNGSRAALSASQVYVAVHNTAPALHARFDLLTGALWSVARPWPKLATAVVPGCGLSAGQIQDLKAALPEIDLQLSAYEIILDSPRFAVGQNITGRVHYLLRPTSKDHWVGAFLRTDDDGMYGARWSYVHETNGVAPFSVPSNELVGEADIRLFGMSETIDQTRANFVMFDPAAE
jgi:hypothetical protein